MSAEKRAYDAVKKVNGRKRYIVTDAMGMLLMIVVIVASVQDRDGGRGLLRRLNKALPSV